ncbi:MAG: M3 family oligoendopeptidase [Candidatus Promineifilaceae bacterium]
MSIEFRSQAWSLAELYESLDAPEIEQSLVLLDEKVKTFETYRPKLEATISADMFNEIIALNEETYRLFRRLSGFGALSFSGNTQDQQAQAYLARISQIAAEASNRTMFFSLWWKQVDEANAERLLATAGRLRYWLERIRAQRPHTLTEAEEKIVNLKNVNGSSALTRLYSSITNRYAFKLDLDDGTSEAREMTRAEIQVYVRSTDPAVRAAAYQALLTVYAEEAPILGQIYQALVRDWRSEHVVLRHHDSPISVRNKANDIPDEVVHTLLDTARKNAPLFQRFFQLKARWLNVDKLRRYDVYAPVVKSTSTYNFDDAVKLVLDSFNEFDPQISQLALRVFEDEHYDSESRKGKRGGAFCATIDPQLTPYVLQSFQGEARDLATMAHELGHAVHAMLAEHQSSLTQQATLPLAETASTFGEMLLLDKMLASDPEEDVQRDLLFSSMDDAYATIMRQIYFAQFEVDAHEAIANNASVDELSEIYLNLLHEQFGDALDISDDFKHEWVAIPHFYNTPFYVYAYAFGQLLALALYRQYKVEGDAMIPRYVELLAAGSSEAPIVILERAGIDVYSAEFWQGGFDYLAEQLEQLEALPLPTAVCGSRLRINQA